MKKKNEKYTKRQTRHKRIRSRVAGTATHPRLCVYRSNKFNSAQIIDDTKGVTICAVTETNLSDKEKKMKPMERAEIVGKLLAEKASQKGIKSVVFDRGGFLYAGRVKALADAARAGGLKF